MCQVRRLKCSVVMFFPCLFCPSDNFETCLALPTCWHASVHALSYWYLFCDPRRWDNSRKVRAPWHVSMSGAPHNVTWMKKHGHNNSAPLEFTSPKVCHTLAPLLSWWISSLYIQYILRVDWPVRGIADNYLFVKDQPPLFVEHGSFSSSLLF